MIAVSPLAAPPPAAMGARRTRARPRNAPAALTDDMAAARSLGSPVLQPRLRLPAKAEPTTLDQLASSSMRRRAEYASAHRSSGGASSSNHSSALGAVDAANSKRSQEQGSGGKITITPTKVIGAIMAIFLIFLIISGSKEWPPKKRRLRLEPFTRGQTLLSKDARQRKRDNINIDKHQLQEHVEG